MNPEITSWVEKLSMMPPDEIATFFRNEGITGKPFSVNSCPIATFLSMRASTRVVAGPTLIIDMNVRSCNDATMQTPYRIQEFMSRFDGGHYPFLVRGVVE